MAHNWHYATGGEKHGPITAPQLKQLVMSGQLSPDDLVWRDDMKEWRKASSVKGLFPDQRSEANSPPQVIPNTMTSGKVQPWWEHPLVLALLVTCCFPVGLIILWTSPRFSTKQKTIWTSVFITFVVGGQILHQARMQEVKNDLSRADVLWNADDNAEAAAIYQSVISKNASLIPDSDKDIVYGRVVDYFSQQGNDIEARRLLDINEANFSPATPLAKTNEGKQLLAQYRKEQEVARRRREAERHKDEPEIVKVSGHPDDDTTYQLLALTAVGTLSQMNYPDTDAVAFNNMMRLAAKELGSENAPHTKKWLMVKETDSEKWSFEGKPMLTVHYGFNVKVTFMYNARKGAMTFAHADIAGKTYGPLVLR